MIRITAASVGLRGGDVLAELEATLERFAKLCRDEDMFS